jgi:DNA repair exonuclease SbcCD nuclease subunit
MTNSQMSISCRFIKSALSELYNKEPMIFPKWIEKSSWDELDENYKTEYLTYTTQRVNEIIEKQAELLEKININYKNKLSQKKYNKNFSQLSENEKKTLNIASESECVDEYINILKKSKKNNTNIKLSEPKIKTRHKSGKKSKSGKKPKPNPRSRFMGFDT